MQDVSQILKQQDLLNDPYWKSIFQSDLRNIFPKYQLAKIDGTKNRLYKIRFMMENIERFMIMELCRKQLQTGNKGGDDQDLLKQLQDIQNQQSFSNYDFNILSKKPAVQELAYKLGKAKINAQLKKHLLNHQKWSQYIKKHIQPPIQYDVESLNTQKIKLANTIFLQDKIVQSAEDDQKRRFGESTQADIIAQRIKQKEISRKLAEIWKKSCKDEFHLEPQWRKDWQKLTKGFQPAQY